MQELQVGPNEAGQRMDKYLKKLLPNAPVSLLYKQLRNKNITLNGKKASGSECLKQGDAIQCFFSQETFDSFSASHAVNDKTKEYEEAYKKWQDVKILYEDDNFIFLNKPAGMLSQKASPSDLSLNEWMIGWLLFSGSLKESDLRTFCPSVANRLDRNTSGIVLCGKSLAGLQALSRLLRERTMQKHYLTICHGILDEDRTIDGYLKKDEKSNRVQISKSPLQGADRIITKYHPLKTSDGLTLLSVDLVTGKSHQIRAHLSSIGHPILGDSKYGTPELVKKDLDWLKLKHQLLHAQEVVFPDFHEKPLEALSGLRIQADLPEQFEKIMNRLFP